MANVAATKTTDESKNSAKQEWVVVVHFGEDPSLNDVFLAPRSDLNEQIMRVLTKIEDASDQDFDAFRIVAHKWTKIGMGTTLFKDKVIGSVVVGDNFA